MLAEAAPFDGAKEERPVPFSGGGEAGGAGSRLPPALAADPTLPQSLLVRRSDRWAVEWLLWAELLAMLLLPPKAPPPTAADPAPAAVVPVVLCPLDEAALGMLAAAPKSPLML